MIYEEEDRQALSDAYHNGYQQGQFDEYASRMGNKQAEKMKARMEQQKHCPYCHDADPEVNLEIYKTGDDGYFAIGSTGDVEIDEGNLVMEENYYLYQEKLFKYCPMCGRRLGSDINAENEKR